MILHTGDKVGDCRRGFLAAMKGKIAQQRVGQGTAEFRKRVSVEK